MLTDRLTPTKTARPTRWPGIEQHLVSLFTLWIFRYQSRRSLRTQSTEHLRDIGLTPEVAQAESAKWFWRP